MGSLKRLASELTSTASGAGKRLRATRHCTAAGRYARDRWIALRVISPLQDLPKLAVEIHAKCPSTVGAEPTRNVDAQQVEGQQIGGADGRETAWRWSADADDMRKGRERSARRYATESAEREGWKRRRNSQLGVGAPAERRDDGVIVVARPGDGPTKID